MAFPSTVILDTFSRADENPLDNSTWGGPIESGGATDLELVSNEVQTSVGEVKGTAYWIGAFNADQEVYCDIVGTFEQVIEVYGRIVDPGLSTVDGYIVQLTHLTDASNIKVVEMTNEALTTIATFTSNDLAEDDAIGMEIVGTTISVYVRISGAWELVDAVTDSTHSAGGVIGIGTSTFVAAPQIDNFGGGNFTAEGPAMEMALRPKNLFPHRRR